MKTYTVQFTMDENGTITLSRTNDGFNTAEVIGCAEILKQDIYRQLIQKDSETDRPKVEVRHERVAIERDKTD